MEFSLPSHELRWFTSAPPTLAAPLLELGAVRGPPVVHAYLRATEPGLGVKWRDDALEVKQRIGVAPEEIAVGTLSARPECWVKWRHVTPEVTPPTPDAWLPVRKERLRGMIASCQVELTRFAFDGRQGFTFALEAWEPETLAEGAALISETLPAINPAAWDCAGWPAFLARPE